MNRLLFLALALAFSSLCDAQLEPQSLEQLVNTNTTGGQLFPTMASAEDGSYMVAWESGALYARKFDADHNPVGDEFLILDAGTDGFELIYAENGKYILVYFLNTTVSFIQILADNSITESAVINSGAFEFDADVRNGKAIFLVADDDNQAQLYARKYDLATSSWEGNELLVSEDNGTDHWYPHIDIHQDGSFVVSYFKYYNTSGCCDYDGRVMRKTFNANMVAEIPEQQVFSMDYEMFVMNEFDTDINGNDELLITTSSGTTSSQRRIRAWILDRNGALLLDESFILFEGSSTTIYSGAKCALYDNGDFVAVTGLEFGGFQNPNDAEAYVLYAQNYNEQNSGWVQMNSTAAGQQRHTVVAPLAAGGFVAAWEGNGFQGDDHGIYSRAYNAYAFPGARLDFEGEPIVDETGNTLVGQLTLATQPSANVTIEVSSNNEQEGVISTAQFTFTPQNWNIPQALTVTGVDDDLDDGDQPFALTVSTESSADGTYAALNDSDYFITNLDDDATITIPSDEDICIADNYTGATFGMDEGGVLITATATSSNPDVVASQDVLLLQDSSAGYIIEIFADSFVGEGTTTITLTYEGDNFDYPASFNLTVGGPSVSAGEDIVACVGDPVMLTAENPDGAEIAWSEGIIDGAENNFSVGEYTFSVTATDADGCAVTDEINVTVNDVPDITFSAGENMEVCEGQPIVLEAINPEGIPFEWSNGIVDGQAFLPPVGENSFLLTGEAECPLSDGVIITVYEKPEIVFSAGDDFSVCFGEEATLFAETDFAVENAAWSGGVTNGEPFVLPEMENTYILTGEAFGCNYSDEVTVTQLAEIESDFSAGEDQVLCFGEEVILEAENTDGLTFEWSGGVMDGEGFEQEEGTEIYTASATIDGCPYSDTVEVEVLEELEQPAIAFFGGDLISTEADDYIWYFNGVAIPTLEGQIIVPLEEGSYQVQVVIDGCQSSLSEPYMYLAVGEENTAVFAAYPNPGTNRLTISANAGSWLEIVNVEGKQVHQQRLGASEQTIQVQNLAAGTYILRLVAENAVQQLVWVKG